MNNTTKDITVLYKEEYTIVFECPEGNASAKFRVYDVTMTGGLDLEGNGDPIYYYRYKDGHTDGLDFNEAEPEYEGFIKWDGCIDFNSSVHFCGYRETLIIGEIIKDLYQLASENIEGFDEDLADFNI